MLSAIAARKARLQLTPQESQSSSPKTQPIPSASSKIPEKRPRNHPSFNSSAKKARKRAPKHDIPTTVITSSEAITSKEEVVIPLNYSDDDSNMSITLDQDTTLIPQGHFPEPVQRERRKAWSPSRPILDSSDEVSDVSEQDFTHSLHQVRPLPSEELEILSTYRPVREQNIFQLSIEEGSALGLSGPAVILILSPSAKVSFVGTYRLRVLRGSISLLGTIIQPSHILHHVFAPRSSPIPVIEACVAHGESSKSLSDIPTQIISTIDGDDVVIVLQELRTGIEGIGCIMRTFEGVFDQVNPVNNPVLPLEGVHLVTSAERGMRAFRVPPSWEVAFSTTSLSSAHETASLSKPPVLLVKGQKNSGKSTFARSLANRLSLQYRRVAFLECDLGQSEFTSGGMVALNVLEQPVFGPPFTHPTLPYQAHYLGAHNPRSSPSWYLRAIQALVDVYRLDLQFATAFVDIEEDEDDNRIAGSIPLVVNTMGWTKGLGLDLARRIEQLVEPSDIFSFDITPSENRAELGGPRLHTVEPCSPSQRFTSSDHRALSILSYFHAVFPDPVPLRQITASRWSTDLPLCARPPYELTSHLALDRIVLTGAGAEDVVRPELKRVLAGALVALVSCSQPPEGEEELYTPGSPPPDPASSTCVGLALVRGVSSDGSKLQLLTPVPPETFANARVIVMGELQLPVWGWLDFRSVEGGARQGIDVPFLRWGRSAGAGSERRRVRRNIMRRSQV